LNDLPTADNQHSEFRLDNPVFFKAEESDARRETPTPQKSARNVCLSGRESRGGAEPCVARHWSWESPVTATSKQYTPVAAISVFTTRPIVTTPKWRRDSPNLSSLFQVAMLFCAR